MFFKMKAFLNFARQFLSLQDDLESVSLSTKTVKILIGNM